MFAPRGDYLGMSVAFETIEPNLAVATDDKISRQPSMSQVSVQLHRDALDVQFEDTHGQRLLR
jgi:hypothetical protein